MKIFDTIFGRTNKTHDLLSNKKPTNLKNDFSAGDNYSKQSYRDIRKRGAIKIGKGTFSFATPLRLGKCIEHIVSFLGNFIGELTKKHWCVLMLILCISFFVYAGGFLIRTNNHIQGFRDHPMRIFSPSGQAEIRSMRQDYSVLAPIIQNPIFPIEPLATYGKMLSQIYMISNQMYLLESIKDAMLDVFHTGTAIPVNTIVERLFTWMKTIKPHIEAISDILKPSASLNNLSIPTLWNALIAQENTWKTLISKGNTFRILILNQNSDELRAGGGFPGTAFIAEVTDGVLSRFDFYDIYALDWQLHGYRPPPEGINRLKSLTYPGRPVEFEIRDANYYPTFAESSKKLDELAREAGIGSLDLVIGINQKFIEDIVALVEPLTIQGIPLKVDHSNVTLVLSMLVEGKKTVTGTPKATVKLFAQTLFDQVVKKGKIFEAIAVSAQNILGNEFIIASPREDVQKTLQDLQLFDRFQFASGDWIYPIFTSISHNKSDRFMERNFTITHTDACDRTLTLEQKHWFGTEEALHIKEIATALGLKEKIPTLLPVQGQGSNVQYVRFVLPLGTKILKKNLSNFHQGNSSDLYSIIEGYTTTMPGMSMVTTLSYRLPPGHCSERTEFFKQPGLRNTRFVVEKYGKILFQEFFK